MPSLAREFLTWETMFRLLRETVLQPLVTGPLLVASMLDILQPSLSFVNRNQLVKSLRILFALGALRTVNNTLSKLVLNNWTTDTWRKGEEVVLITGGGSGIGMLMARDLAQWSKAIVILDLVPPKASLRRMTISANSSPANNANRQQLRTFSTTKSTSAPQQRSRQSQVKYAVSTGHQAS